MRVYRGVTGKNVITVFQYDPLRSGKAPDDCPVQYKGRIQTDGYVGYNRIASDPDIVRYGCWAHARRNFTDECRSQQNQALQPSEITCVVIEEVAIYLH